MALTIRPATSNDRARWNAYVHAHPKACAYHNFAWVESVEQAYGHPNASLLALEGEEVVGVLPITKMQIPLSGHYYCSLPFCDMGYAIANDQPIVTALLEKLREMKAQSGAKKIEYRDTSEANASALLDEEIQGKKVSMFLPLPETSDELLTGFKSKLRSQIRKAEKNGLTSQTGNSQQLIDQFYQVFIYNMRKLGSPVHSKLWYDCLLKNYQDDLLVSVVYTDKLPIGGGIVLRNGLRACIPWASTLAEHNRLAPNMLLYWSLLETVTDTGIREFDFGRSTYGEGTFKFKQQWGAQPRPLNWHLPDEQAPDELPQGGPGKLRTLVEQTWPKLPIGVTTAIGPIIRKYISL